MALVVLLRGVNVGGNKTFRPKLLAEQLKAFDVVNIGAAGTFVVRKPGAKKKFLEAIAKKLPVQCEIIVAEGSEFLRLEKDHPFGAEEEGVVRFVSSASTNGKGSVSVPLYLPTEKDWLVRLVRHDKQFVFGEYRRHMKTIDQLTKIDKILGATRTTRNWNTVMQIVKVLKTER